MRENPATQATPTRKRADVQILPILVSRRTAGVLLDLSVRTISQLIACGELRARRVGKRVLLLRDDLEKFARER
jgi:excisionase family DNA binding protein